MAALAVDAAINPCNLVATLAANRGQSHPCLPHARRMATPLRV